MGSPLVDNSQMYTQQTMSSPMTALSSMPSPLISPTNDAMMGFMTNSMPAIVKMLPTQSNSTSALAATAVTMTIHTPNESTADTMAISNAMQAALKAQPIPSSSSQSLAGGENYYNSPWRFRAPLSSPAKLIKNARNNLQQHQQLHQHHHHNQNQKRILPQMQMSSAQQRFPARAQKVPGQNFGHQLPIQQAPLVGHEIEDFNSMNAPITSNQFSTPQMQQQPINNQLNEAFEQMQMFTNSNSIASNELNNNNDNDDLFNQVELQTNRPMLSNSNNSKLPVLLPQTLPSNISTFQQQSQQQAKSTSQQLRKPLMSGGGY